MENIQNNPWNNRSDQLEELIKIGLARHIGDGCVQYRKGTDEGFSESQFIAPIDSHLEDYPEVIEVQLDGVRIDGLLNAFNKKNLDQWLQAKREHEMILEAINALPLDLSETDLLTNSSISQMEGIINDHLTQIDFRIGEAIEGAYGWSSF